MLPIHKLRFKNGTDVHPLYDLLSLDTKKYDGIISQVSYNFINGELRVPRNGDCMYKVNFPISTSFYLHIDNHITKITTDSEGEYIFPEFIILFLIPYTRIKISVENDVSSVSIDFIFIINTAQQNYIKEENYISEYFHPSNMYKLCYKGGMLGSQHIPRDIYINIRDMIKTNKINPKLLYKLLFIDKSFEPTEENLPSSMFNYFKNDIPDSISKHKLYHLLDKIVDKSSSSFNDMLSSVLLKDINDIVISYLDLEIIDILPDVLMPYIVDSDYSNIPITIGKRKTVLSTVCHV